MDGRVKPGHDGTDVASDAVSLICPSRPSVLSKKISFCHLVETAIEPLHPVPTKGRFAIVTDVGRDAVDAGIAPDERANPADGEVVWS